MSENKDKKRSIKGHILSVVITLAAFAVYDYTQLPAYNFQSYDLWVTVCLVLAFFGVCELVFNSGLRLEQTDSGTKAGANFVLKTTDQQRKLPKYCITAAVAIGVVAILCSAASSTFFNAKRYAAIAGPIEARDFIEDTPPSDTISDIALMDSNSARIIGARALGSLSELVSQFEIGYRYTQINLDGRPMKVSPLEYADFFRWWSNKKEGIPGYIAVDPVENTSKYVKLETPMQYGESAYFSHDLRRALRFRFRTAIFGESYFEIADTGTPYYVTSVLKKDVFLFGGTDVKGAVIMNACTGSMEYYDVKDIPSWVDIVYDGDMLTQRYDWYGELSGGYFNSIFAKKDCKHVTDDYGYKMFDDDVWVFTGVTSVASDESNIGFVLMNSRTAEIRYYAIPVAEEYSVMRSAEGEVQHLGYTASFPSVINVGGQPTYIMALKDKGSLVKQYALIHVARYNIVVTGETQKEAMDKYRAALVQNSIEWETDSGEPVPESWLTVKVKDIKFLVEDGNSFAYIVGEDDAIFKVSCSKHETVVLVKIGDTIKINTGLLESQPKTVYPVVDIEI